jgi:hypothetical protein
MTPDLIRPLTRTLPSLLCLAMSSMLSTTVLACAMRSVPADTVKAPVDGRVVQAFTCKDTDGEHLFIESRQVLSSPAGKSPSLALSFYKFTLGSSGHLLKRWQARDFVMQDDPLPLPLPRTARSPRVDRFVARDVDGDGLAEAFVSYALPGQGLNPDDGKLLVFYKDRKYAIRGAVASGPGEFGTRTMDPGFSALPAAVQTYALGLWDAVALPKGPPPVTLSQARLR